MQTWSILIAAILVEVAATVALKLSDGFSRVVPSAIVVIGYGISFVLLSKVLARGFDVGFVYAVWSAAGIALIASIGVLFLGERLTSTQVVGLVLIVAGVAALQLGGRTQ